MMTKIKTLVTKRVFKIYRTAITARVTTEVYQFLNVLLVSANYPKSNTINMNNQCAIMYEEHSCDYNQRVRDISLTLQAHAHQLFIITPTSKVTRNNKRWLRIQ